MIRKAYTVEGKHMEISIKMDSLGLWISQCDASVIMDKEMVEDLIVALGLLVEEEM